MTTVTASRAALMDILLDISSIYDGEIYAEDVNAVMTGLDLSPAVYHKVSATLEELISVMRQNNPSARTRVEHNVRFLLGLAKLSR